jgi:hypothetical protein
MVGQHETANAVLSSDIGGSACECHLYGRRTPRYEVGQLTLTYSKERLVHLRIDGSANGFVTLRKPC